MPPAPPVLPPAPPSPWRACHAPDPWECMPHRELHPHRHGGPPWSLDSWARPTDGDDSGPTNGSRQPWTIGSRAAGPPHGPPLYKPSPADGELICVVHFSVEPCQIFARAPTGGNGFRRYDISILVLEISLLFGRRPCHPASRMGSAPHRNVIKDDFGGKLPSGRPFRLDIRSRPRLPHGRGFTCGRVFTVRRRGKNRVRADASPSPPLSLLPLPSPLSLPPFCCPRKFFNFRFLNEVRLKYILYKITSKMFVINDLI
jgi:hypothetical protein